jgi:hypothetical protein
MKNIQKLIVALLAIAIIFSIVSTLINFSLLKFEFKPIDVKVPSNIKQGNPTGNIRLVIEGNPASAEGTANNENR